MKPVGKLGVSLLSLLLFASPIMACAMQANTMTAAERDCCKRMAQECGKRTRSLSHSCCKTVAMPDHLPAIKSAPDFNSDNPSFVATPAMPQPPLVMMVAEPVTAPWASNMHGPPGSPLSGISVLRI
jgi:hypothetical protein